MTTPSGPHGTDRSNQAVRDLITRAPISNQLAWWEWCIPNNLVIAGPRKLTMLGYDPSDFEGLGYEAYTALLHPEDHARAMGAMERHLNGEAPLYEIDYRTRTAQGTWMWCMDRGVILERQDNGSPLRMRGIVIDLGPDLANASHDEAVVRAVRSAIPISGSGRTVLICAQCGRLNHGSEWSEVPPSFGGAFPSQVSHAICPRCITTLYPDLAAGIRRRLSQ